jgi:hypothetical protein
VAATWYSRFGAALKDAVKDNERLRARIKTTPSPKTGALTSLTGSPGGSTKSLGSSTSGFRQIPVPCAMGRAPWRNILRWGSDR